MKIAKIEFVTSAEKPRHKLILLREFILYNHATTEIIFRKPKCWQFYNLFKICPTKKIANAQMA